MALSRPVDLSLRTFGALAVALPIALWAVHHPLGHPGDVGFFHDWYLAFRDGSTFYRDGPGVNYPIAGALLVCGPAALVELALGRPLDLATFRVVLKATLVIGEVAFVFVAAALARLLGAGRPRTLALGLWALPSTWAVGAWFGQIDVWGSTLLLASAWGLIRHRRDGRLRDLAVGLGALHVALLTKQLTWFAAPGLGLLVLTGLRRHADRRAWAVALASPLVWLAADPFVALPDGWRSHLWFVIAGGGSDHGRLAIASGASLWALVAPGGTPAEDLRWCGLDSFAWGWIAWTAAMGAAIHRVCRARLSDASLVALAGLGHLAMATLLTGVHERYLAHAIPLLVLAGGRDAPWRRALGAATAVLAGLFVLASLTPAAFVGAFAPLAHPAPLALVSFAWLLVELADPAPAPRYGAQSTSSASKLR